MAIKWIIIEYGSLTSVLTIFQFWLILMLPIIIQCDVKHIETLAI
jgi:hypothetical protein